MLPALLAVAACGSGGTAAVELVRAPNGGVQPRIAAVDGTYHLLYFDGEAASGDLYYATSEDLAEFSEPVRVNSQPGSAVAAGTIRGGELAVGSNGQVHVAWNGSSKAEPKGPKNPEQPDDSPHNGLPFLYAQSDGSGGFTDQRNLITRTFALDGGGTIAADGEGNVYAAWHGSTKGSAPGEAGRQVWMTRSSDGGKTFSSERAVSPPEQGACGCCSMHLFAGSEGRLAAFYRTAREVENRDGLLLSSSDGGETFSNSLLQSWKIGACPMSSASFSEGPAGLLISWETAGQVWFAPIDIGTGAMTADPVSAPGEGSARKHPSLAQDEKGNILLAWAEVGGWGQGGTVHWQTFDREGRPLEESGNAGGLPAWSFATATVLPNGSFAVVY